MARKKERELFLTARCEIESGKFTDYSVYTLDGFKSIEFYDGTSFRIHPCLGSVKTIDDVAREISVVFNSKVTAIKLPFLDEFQSYE